MRHKADAILIALLNTWDLLSPKVGSEEWPSSQRHQFISMMGRGLNLVTSKIYRISTSGLTKTWTESAEWKGKVQVSLWAYLKIFDLVSNEYPDPRLIIHVERELKT